MDPHPTVVAQDADEVEHPYSPAYEIDGIGYVSGALPVDDDGGIVGGRKTALDAALRKLEQRLATIGMSLREVVKVTYFVTDMALRDDANEQFVRAFRHPRPARSFVGVSSLPYGASVEIDAIAHRNAKAAQR
jgi:enamine deaminase RidA (YjgF/YER057c/UK114 family)